MEWFNDPKIGPRWSGLGAALENYPDPKARRAELEKFCHFYPTWFFEVLTEVPGKPGQRTVLETFQIKFLNDKTRFRISNKTRQAGGSLVLAMDKFWKAYSQHGYRCDIISVSRRDAQDKITYIRDFYLSLPQKWRARAPLAIDNTEHIAFHNGRYKSEIRSIAATSGVRGGSKDIVFDEAAHILNLDELFKAALPATVRSEVYGADFVSTPNGKLGKFYDIISDPIQFKQFSRHEFGWWDVSFFSKDVHLAHQRWTQEYDRNPSMLRVLYDEFATDALRLNVDSLTEEEYQQEYCGIFIDESSAFFTYDLIDRNRKHDEPQYEGHKDYVEHWTARPKGNEYDVFFGIDFAEGRKGGDSTSIQIVERRGDTYHHRAWFDLDHKNGFDTFDAQLREIGRLIHQFRPQEVRLDETGLGRALAADIKKNYSGVTHVMPITFTNALKEEMALNVKNLLEKEQLTLQFENQRLRGQLHNLQRRISEHGNIQYEGKPHDDMFWALALAVKGATRTGFRILTL